MNVQISVFAILDPIVFITAFYGPNMLFHATCAVYMYVL